MNKKLFVFDFDDTLVTSDLGSAWVHHSDGTSTELHGHKWSDYKEKPGDRFDFQDFAELRNPQPHPDLWGYYLRCIDEYGHDHVWICTARGYPDPIRKFLTEAGLPEARIACMAIPPGDNNGHHKVKFISSKLAETDYRQVEFFDDRHDCVTEVKRLSLEYPTVKFAVYRVAEGILHAY